MTWSRFFRTVGLLIVSSAAVLALIWYGVPEWLDGSRLWSVAIAVFAISITGLFLSILIPAVKRRWWRTPVKERLVRQRLGAFYYVFWGVLILNFATYMAITLRSHEIELDYSSSPMIELNRLFSAMSTVSMTLIFAGCYLMMRFSRYVHDVGAASEPEET